MAKPGAGHPQGSGKENSNTLTRRGGEEVQQHQAGEILRGGAEPSYCCRTVWSTFCSLLHTADVIYLSYFSSSFSEFMFFGHFFKYKCLIFKTLITNNCPYL